MNDLILRDAAVGDAALLCDLSRRTFIETFGHLYRQADLATFLEGLNEEAWQRDLADPAIEVRLATAGTAAAGFAKLGPLTLPVEAPRALEVRQLYLLRPWHGIGLADQLMEWLLARAEARDAEALVLSVWSENHRARHFYARYGFVYVGPYRFMVGSHADEDEIMMLKLKR